MILIDGKKTAAEIRVELKAEISELVAKGKNVPGLVAMLVGENPASQIYVKSKGRACEEIGMRSKTEILPTNISEEELLKKILENTELLDKIEIDESSYVYHLDEVAKIFHDFLDETFFSIEKKDNDLIIHLVTTNLAKKFKELARKRDIGHELEMQEKYRQEPVKRAIRTILPGTEEFGKFT